MTETSFQPVDLVLNIEKKALELLLPSDTKRLNLCLTALFSKLNHDIVGNLEKMREVIIKIGNVPSYQHSIKSVGVQKKSAHTGQLITQTCTMANLEIFLLIEQALSQKNFTSWFISLVQQAIGLKTHLQSLQNNLIVDYNIDAESLLTQIKDILGFLPHCVRAFLKLTQIEDDLQRLLNRRQWQREHQVPSLFKDHFPITEQEMDKHRYSAGQGGGDGHNMLNPKRTQEPKPKDDTTPFRTRPGRDR